MGPGDAGSTSALACMQCPLPSRLRPSRRPAGLPCSGNSLGLLQLVQARSFSIWSFLAAFSWQVRRAARLCWAGAG